MKKRFIRFRWSSKDDDDDGDDDDDDVADVSNATMKAEEEKTLCKVLHVKKRKTECKKERGKEKQRKT